VGDFYRDRFNVDLDPRKEIISLIGSKDGLAHILLSYINPGDRALVLDPANPVYKTSVVMVGGEPITLPLKVRMTFCQIWPN